MKLRILIVLLFSLFIAYPSNAQLPLKTITLKDGSVLKGRVLNMNNGVYTIQTPYLNEIKIEEANVESIADHTPAPLTSDRLKNEVEAVQGKVMNNPQLMQEIQETMNNPKVREIMQDPEFMKAIMSMDPDAIQQNERTREMLNQPEIRELFQKIEATLDHHPSAE